MNREIKFRGQDNSGKWYYGDLIHSERNFKKIVEILDWSTDDVKHEVKKETVGQSTGLQDKNGKDIYENDIITAKGYSQESTFEKIITIVEWGSKSHGWSIKSPYIDRYTKKKKVKYYSLANVIEVIGNMHDNPELLKQ